MTQVPARAGFCEEVRQGLERKRQEGWPLMETLLAPLVEKALGTEGCE